MIFIGLIYASAFGSNDCAWPALPPPTPVLTPSGYKAAGISSYLPNEGSGEPDTFVTNL